MNLSFFPEEKIRSNAEITSISTLQFLFSYWSYEDSSLLLCSYLTW